MRFAIYKCHLIWIEMYIHSRIVPRILQLAQSWKCPYFCRSKYNSRTQIFHSKIRNISLCWDLSLLFPFTNHPTVKTALKAPNWPHKFAKPAGIGTLSDERQLSASQDVSSWPHHDRSVSEERCFLISISSCNIFHFTQSIFPWCVLFIALQRCAFMREKWV